MKLLATPSRKYIRKTDEIEVVEQKERFGYSKIGNDPRWYAPEIVLRDINLENKNVKSTNQMSSDFFGTIAVSAFLFSLLKIPAE
jgi:hypothetical protein